jgi:jumonji domain-containing protein 2
MSKEKLSSPLQVAIEASGQDIPGVTEPFTYFGTKYSTSTGHAEDCSLFSCNFHHFGAPKHWLFITQAGKKAFEE